MKRICIEITPMVEAMIELIKATETKPPTKEQIDKHNEETGGFLCGCKAKGDELSFEEAAALATFVGATKLTLLFAKDNDVDNNGVGRTGHVPRRP